MTESARLSENKRRGSLSPSQIARESDWRLDVMVKTPRSGLNIMSGRVRKPVVSDGAASRRGRRNPIDGSGASVVHEGQITTSQPQKYRCYVPGCSVAQKQKRNLSTHFKTKHVGIPWRIKLVEDPPQSKPAEECEYLFWLQR